MQTQLQQKRSNSAFGAGVLILLVAVVLGFIPFLAQVPGQRVLPWANLFLSLLAVVLILAGLRRTIAEPERYSSKARGWVLTIVSSLLLLLSIFAFYAARNLPDANAAPRVGQRAPDFELKDSNSQTVSLAQLLATSADPSRNAARPKAVLLVFYRGYW